MKAVVGSGNQQHVAFVDRRPAANAGSVDAEAFFEGIFVELADGIGNVLLQTGQIGEAQVELLGFVFLGVFEDIFRCFRRRGSSSMILDEVPARVARIANL